MEFKLDDKVRCISGGDYGAGWELDKIFVIGELTGSSPLIIAWPKDGDGRGIYTTSLELYQKGKNMTQNDIPKTLSVMERVKETPERKALIKAGYIEKGEYTQKAKDLAIVLFLETQETKLVELANEELAEVKE